ncbi:MAG TPA: LysM peptidoglycan-binding domain-containing protein [Marmoricola sp.]|nr:LysM peptidoglycan-binding domain-containing protein [Marmoricola sp.]HMY08880.1 LysM peptidoglycan-binding domain-containing protein [Marmoricola sp.]
MSSTTLVSIGNHTRWQASAEATQSPAAQSELRLTRRGRIVFTMIFLSLVAAAMIFVGGRAAASFDAGNPPAIHYITVSSGDTLYSLAGDYAEPGQIREMVQQIEDLNSLDSVTIYPGQRLAIPVG